MDSPLSSACYSFSWALGVVSRLREKYPRATDIFCEKWRCTPRNLATALAKRDEIYPQCREVIHILDNYLQRTPEVLNSPTAVGCMIFYLRRKGRVRLADRLAQYEFPV